MHLLSVGLPAEDSLRDCLQTTAVDGSVRLQFYEINGFEKAFSELLCESSCHIDPHSGVLG